MADSDSELEAFEHHERASDLLKALHQQTAKGIVDASAHKCAMPPERRMRIASWLIRELAWDGMDDSLLIAVLGLMDRLAAAFGQRFGTSPFAMDKPVEDSLVGMLALVLVALKAAGPGARLADDHEIRAFVIPLGGKSGNTLWPRVLKMEREVLCLLEYDVTVPTPLDIIEVISLEVCKAAATAQASSAESWLGLSLENITGSVKPRARFAFLAAYILELATVHACEALHKSGVRHLSQAVVAVALALGTLEAPSWCWVPLKKAVALLTDAERQQIPAIRQAFQDVYGRAPEESAVRVKWIPRLSKAGLKFPPEIVPFQLALLKVPDADGTSHDSDVPSEVPITPKKVLKEVGKEEKKTPEKKRPRQDSERESARVSEPSKSLLKRRKKKHFASSETEACKCSSQAPLHGTASLDHIIA